MYNKKKTFISTAAFTASSLFNPNVLIKMSWFIDNSLTAIILDCGGYSEAINLMKIDRPKSLLGEFSFAKCNCRKENVTMQ